MSNIGNINICLKNENLNISATLFNNMEVIEKYHFILHDDLHKVIDYLEDFELLLKHPVEISANIRVFRDEPTEMNYRGYIQEVIYQKQFFWNHKKENDLLKAEAIVNFCAASLHLEHPTLDLEECKRIVSDEIALSMDEKEGYRLVKVSLQTDDYSIGLFRAYVNMETMDYSGLRIVDILPHDILALRGKLTPLLSSGAIHLVVE